jgi:MFS family permease
MFSNIFFFAGNLICGLAKDEWFMIFGRVIAGMGGGGLMAISTFVGSDLVPLRQRGLIQGLGNVCYGLGGGLGGVYGGWINDIKGWRFAFYYQLPLIAISAILVACIVKIPVKEKNMSRIKRVDFLGAFTLVSTLVLLLVGLNSGGNIVPWNHPIVLATLPLSAVGFLIFIYVEDKVASEPVIPVRLLLNRTVACACLTNWFTTMSAFMLLYYAPVYFQVLGYTPTQAGARLIPQSIGASIGSLGAGYIMRATGRYYILNIFIESLLLISSALIAGTFDQNTATVPPYIYFFLAGVGYGGMLTVTLLALIAAVDHKYQAVVTSASYAFRSTGSTIGITIASAVFQNILKAQLWKRFGDRPDAAELIGRLRNSIGEVQRLPEELYEDAIKSYMWALKGVWFTMLGVATLGVVVSLGMREHVLHKNLARR